MSDQARSELYPAGSILFERGDSGRNAYLIMDGTVEISTDQGGRRVVIANLGCGEVFGELALISEQSRMARARALEDTEVMVITREHLQSLIDSADPLLTNLLRGNLGRFIWTQRFMLHHSSGTGTDTSLQKQAEKDLALEKDIERGIGAGEFELYYQPVVHVANGRIAGFEALMRWPHPEKGMISPGEFIPVAEQTGQILTMGYKALKQALEDLKRFESQAKGEPLFMSVNVSGRQLLEMSEIERLGELLSDSGVEPSRIKLEITESLLVDDPMHAAVALEKLREKGVRLAIDDFGTGYSSLSYLHLFPLDTLKIDRSFVANMRADERRYRIVRAISRLARDLELDIIAEGVEYPEEMTKLQGLECDYIQGFLFARPMPAADILPLLKANKPLQPKPQSSDQ